MQQEFEAKFLNVNHDEVRDKLKALGAKLEYPMRSMRRVMIDHEDSRYQKSHQNERFRVRDEGEKVTVTYKKTVEGSSYPIEHEIEVDSFDEARKVFKSLGLIEYSYQETKREAWELDGVEVVLDLWPWLKPQIEIEGKDEEAIKAVTKKLGFNWEDASFGPVDNAYRVEYKKMGPNDSVGYIDKLLFEGDMPDYLKERM